MLFGSSTRDRQPEIVKHDDTYIGGRSESNTECVLHDDLGRKNRTTRYILPRHRLYEWFSQFHSCRTYSVLSRSPSVSPRLSHTYSTEKLFFSSLPNISTIYPPQHFVTSLTFRYPHPLYPEPHKVNALDTVAEQCSSDGQGMQSVNQAVCLLVAAGRQCCDDRLDRYHAETHRHNILLQCSTTNNNTAMRLDQQIHSHTLQSIYSITLLSFTHASGMV